MAGVEGLIRDGSAATRNNPVIVGGVDGSGNVQALAVDTSGNLDVVVATGPVTVADGADVAEGAVADTAVAAGAAGTVSAKLRRLTTDLAALLAQIPASLGIKTAANSLSVAPASDATFPVTTIVPGTAATNLGKAEDAAHTTGDTGVFMLGVRNDALVSQSNTDLDYTPITVDAQGRVIVGSNTASGATDAGNPIKMGGKYNSTLPTFTDGQRADMQVNSRGAQYVALHDAGTNRAIAVNAFPTDAFSTGSFGNSASVSALPMVYNGATLDRLRTFTTFKTRADASITAGTAVSIWAPASTKKPRLLGGELSTAAAGQIILKSGASAGAATEKLRSPQLAAGAVWSIPPIGNGILAAAGDDNWYVDVSATGNVGGWVGGTEE